MVKVKGHLEIAKYSKNGNSIIMLCGQMKFILFSVTTLCRNDPLFNLELTFVIHLSYHVFWRTPKKRVVFTYNHTKNTSFINENCVQICVTPMILTCSIDQSTIIFEVKGREELTI